MKSKLVNVSIALFLLNIFLWLVIAGYNICITDSNSPDYILIEILLFLEPIVFTIALIVYMKRLRLMYVITLIFLFINSFLSITDQVGFLDILSLFFNLMLFVVLVVQWKHMMKKIKD